MNKNFIKKMKNRLLEDRKQILIKIAAESDRQVDVEGDEADEVQASLLIYLNDQMSSRYSSSLNKIVAALDKIEKDEYGYCETCDEPIFEKRLEFNPCFENCIACAEKKERSLRK